MGTKIALKVTLGEVPYSSTQEFEDEMTIKELAEHLESATFSSLVAEVRRHKEEFENPEDSKIYGV